MQAGSAWDLIFMGTSLRFLQDAQAKWSPNSPGGVVENYDLFQSSCDRLGLKVTARAAQGRLGDLINRLRVVDDAYMLTPADASDISAKMTEVRVALEAEASGSVIYRTSERRYDTTKLMGEIDKLFAPGAVAAMSDIALYDFEEAGRALAFGLPTAVAFHLLRGTEEVLRAYYRSWVRRGRMRTMLWGPMVLALKAPKGRQTPDMTCLNNLDNIRVAFRNPTDHPEKIYDIGEAEDLFGLCIEVVNRMVRTMRGVGAI
jgi:hypothetical protein